MNIICGNYNQNPKMFYEFINSKRHENSGVSSHKRNGITHNVPKSQSEILNDQFVSVFTEVNKIYVWPR